MSCLAWIVLGLLAGFIGSKIVNKQGEGMILDIVLGIVGALAGGWFFNTFGAFRGHGSESIQPAGRCNRKTTEVRSLGEA